MTEAQTTAAIPALTVREATADQVPPLPDPAKCRAYFDSQGRVPAPMDIHAGHYQKLVLEVRTGTLYFYADDWRIERDPEIRTDRVLPVEGCWSPPYWRTVPDVIYWTIDSGVSVAERPYLTLDEGNAFAYEVAPLAEALLLGLLSVPGTDLLDWSAEAASAGLDIAAACTRHKHPPQGRRAELVDMSEAVAVYPRIVSECWATMTDAELDREAESLTRNGLRHHPQLAEDLDIDPSSVHASLVGTRAWLYQHRLRSAGDRPMRTAQEWLAAADTAAVERAHTETRQPAAPYVTANTNDAELEQAAEQMTAAARAEGIVLLGDPKQAAATRRTRLRQQVLDELEMFGTARAEAETTVKNSRAAIYARLYEAFSWEGHPAPSDAELGRLAQMSRQAVNKLHEPLLGEAHDGRE